MCGIVGYVGGRDVVEVLISSLKRLEYRGYDSSGIAVVAPGAGITIRKKKGPIAVLEEAIGDLMGKGFSAGVAHTRWATHGEPNDVNAHPHLDCEGKIAVVHNGIIENFAELKHQLMKRGHRFASDTDTEVIAHLLEDLYRETGDPLKAIEGLMPKLSGAYALGIVFADVPDRVYFVRQQSPLVIGESEVGSFFASDIPAILTYTRDIMPLEDGMYGYISADGVHIYRDGKKISFNPIHIDWDVEAAEKKGYPHFMLKEIHEQPQTAQDAMRGRIDLATNTVVLPELEGLQDRIKSATKLYVTACGTAFHAGLVFDHLIKTMTDLAVESLVASEFRYMPWDLSRDADRAIGIVVSQSGETADTIAAMRLLKAYDIPVIGVVNVVGSTIYRESDYPVVINAGPEIAVASTKAFTNQLIVLYLMAFYMAKLRGTLDPSRERQLVADLLTVPSILATVLGLEEYVKGLADRIKDATSVFFIGRLLDHITNLEGSLKLKEISYIHSEAIPAGELKHGPLALISEDTPVIATVLQERVKEKSLSNILEVKARKAPVIVLGYRDDTEAEMVADYFVSLPRISQIFSPLVGIIPLQLLAYYTAVMRGNNVDKPRNLAKSVTVE